MNIRNKRRLVMLMAGALLFSGNIILGKNTTADAGSKKVYLSKNNVTLNIKEKNDKVEYGSFKLKVKKNNKITIKKTTFISKNKKIVTVNKKGKIVAKKAGKTVVSAKVKYTKSNKTYNKKLNLKVTVKDLRVKESAPAQTPTASTVATTAPSLAPVVTAPSPTPTATPKSTPGEIKENGSLFHEGYELEKVVVLSRHNIRSPLSNEDSLLGKITPHKWFEWSSNASELSLRGGILETQMGQYFRKWIEKEGLFPQNYRPENGEVKFYSNSKQRTLATSKYFAAGFLPVADTDIIFNTEYDTMDPVFTPQFTFTSDSYADAVKAQIRELFSGDYESLSDSYKLISDVVDMEDSEAWKSGSVNALKTGDDEFFVENYKEPSVKGSLSTACSISDALVLQYYEQNDPVKAAFGKDLSYEDWKNISRAKDTYVKMLYSAPLVSKNIAHPLVEEIDKEMEADDRKFSFLCGHDSNIASVLSALDAEDYDLTYSIEDKTSIGIKLVLSKYKSQTGEEFWSADLVYQSTKQLRDMSILDLNNPPAIHELSFKGMKKNADGLYAEEDMEKRFKDTIADYDEIVSDYTEKKEAA